MRDIMVAIDYYTALCVLTASRSEIRTVSISSTSATTVYSVRPSSNELARYNVPWNIILVVALVAVFVTFRRVPDPLACISLCNEHRNHNQI